jgi:hypothetical protein
MPTTAAETEPTRSAGFPSPRWWIEDRQGRIAIAQLPNPPLLVWMATVAIGWVGVLDDHREVTLTRVGQGALVAWALDELLRGVSPVRRVIGAVVLVVMLLRLFG